jgi:hypothetical protein
VAKARRSKPVRNRRKTAPQPRRAPGTRHEYAVLSLQFSALEAQVARNRTDLDIQLRRIAQLQDELDAVKKALPTER